MTSCYLIIPKTHITKYHHTGGYAFHRQILGEHNSIHSICCLQPPTLCKFHKNKNVLFCSQIPRRVPSTDSLMIEWVLYNCTNIGHFAAPESLSQYFQGVFWSVSNEFINSPSDLCPADGHWFFFFFQFLKFY